MLGLPWQKQVGSVILEGFASGGAGSPLSALSCSSIQAPGGRWAVGFSASPSAGMCGRG